MRRWVTAWDSVPTSGARKPFHFIRLKLKRVTTMKDRDRVHFESITRLRLLAAMRGVLIISRLFKVFQGDSFP